MTPPAAHLRRITVTADAMQEIDGIPLPKVIEAMRYWCAQAEQECAPERNREARHDRG